MKVEEKSLAAHWLRNTVVVTHIEACLNTQMGNFLFLLLAVWKFHAQMQKYILGLLLDKLFDTLTFICNRYKAIAACLKAHLS